MENEILNIRKVFLDDLPRGGKSIKHTAINWKSSVGYKIHFIYDDIKGDIEIISYNSKNRKLTISYKDRIKEVATQMFLICELGDLLGVRTSDFKIKIGTHLKNNKRDLIITDRIVKTRYDEYGKKRNDKCYKYKCLKCGLNVEDIIKMENIIMNTI